MEESIMVQRYHCTDNRAFDKDDEGDFVLHDDYEGLRLLLAEVIIRLGAFDGAFMKRLVDTLEDR
jgi:hypothetical protein